MTTTYSPSSRFWEGQQADPSIKDSWGTPLSGNFTLVDSAINGISTIDLTGLSAYTLTVVNGGADQAREQVLNFINTPSALCTVTLPNVSKVGWAVNNTTGGFSVILSAGGSTNATVPADGFWHLYSCDGNGNVTLPVTGGGVTPGGGQALTGTSLAISGNASISGALSASTISLGTANISGLAAIQSAQFQAMTSASATFGTSNTTGQASVGGLLVAASLQVNGAFTAQSFNPGTINTGSIQATSATISGTLSAGTFNPSNISTGALSASSATISGTLSAGSFNPSSISTGAISASSASITGNAAISGTLTAGSFNPSAINTGNGTFSGAVSVGSLTSSGAISCGTQQVTCGTLSSNSIISGASSFRGSLGQLNISPDASNAVIINSVGGFLAYINFTLNGVNIGSIQPLPTKTGVSYNTTSDQRLKIFDQEIQPEESGKIIDRLEPVWFRWKSNPGAEREPGFFAQQVHRFYRWAVSPGSGKATDKDFVPWQMDAAKLMPVVIAELKHLRARVAELEEQCRSGR